MDSYLSPGVEAGRLIRRVAAILSGVQGDAPLPELLCKSSDLMAGVIDLNMDDHAIGGRRWLQIYLLGILCSRVADGFDVCDLHIDLAERAQAARSFARAV